MSHGVASREPIINVSTVHISIVRLQTETHLEQGYDHHLIKLVGAEACRNITPFSFRSYGWPFSNSVSVMAL